MSKTITGQKQLDLVHYLMCRCDLGNGRITDMTKEEIDDTWTGVDLDGIVQIAKKTCASFNKKVTDPCPECKCQLVGKGLRRGGVIVCSNPKCDYWFCY